MVGAFVAVRLESRSVTAQERTGTMTALLSRLHARLPGDARVYQILFLATLLATGALVRDFSLRPEQMALTFAAGLATQALFLRLLKIRGAGYLSAVITCFGLSILLRADTVWVHPLAATVAIASKFVLRVNGKHVFNPANLGVMVALLLLPGAWISPGQWGSDLALAAWFVALGALVSKKARRWDISWMFLACFVGLVAARVAWLGQSPHVLLHQLQSGALLLFTFFMISDPMTIPNRRAATAGVCRGGGPGGLRLAIRIVPAQRAGVGAVLVHAAGAPARPAAAGRALSVAAARAAPRSSHAARPTLLPSRADRLHALPSLASAGRGGGNRRKVPLPLGGRG